MKKLLIASALILALGACKKEEKKEQAAAPAPAPAPRVVELQDLADSSMKSHDDWTKDLGVYIDDVLTCANSSPVQTKYVFRADAFETPPIALILLKGENDKLYACSVEPGDLQPHYKIITLKIPEKSPRFYPGELPKPDSCLNNTRVLDKTGHTAGWLSKITC